jgi:hypothetical protein
MIAKSTEIAAFYLVAGFGVVALGTFMVIDEIRLAKKKHLG